MHLDIEVERDCRDAESALLDMIQSRWHPSSFPGTWSLKEVNLKLSAPLSLAAQKRLQRLKLEGLRLVVT